jgi:hypothetical protein
VGGKGGDGTRAVTLFTFFFTSLLTPFGLFVRGTHTPRMALGAEDFLCLGLARRGGVRFPLSLSTYLFRVNGRINENKTNKTNKW